MVFFLGITTLLVFIMLWCIYFALKDFPKNNEIILNDSVTSVDEKAKSSTLDSKCNLSDNEIIPFN